MVPEWIAVLAAAMMYVMGLLTCGVLIGRTPFWRGVRDVFSLDVFNIHRRGHMTDREIEKEIPWPHGKHCTIPRCPHCGSNQ